jgi:hypothetical protein
VRRERATVRSTIYNQISLRLCACVATLCTALTHRGGVERSNDVHEVLSLITRFASVASARTIVVASRPLLSSGVRSTSLFTSRPQRCIVRSTRLCHRPYAGNRIMSETDNVALGVFASELFCGLVNYSTCEKPSRQKL